MSTTNNNCYCCKYVYFDAFMRGYCKKFIEQEEIINDLGCRISNCPAFVKEEGKNCDD